MHMTLAQKHHMIRTLTCCLLVLGSGNAMAEKLYRWVEADGSITFSPTPPPDSKEFKTVAGAKSVSASSTAVVATGEKGVVDAPATPGTETAVDAQIASAASSVLTPARLRYAPDTTVTKAPDSSRRTAPRGSSSNLPMIAASSKRGHCQNLKKRVVSLERRLRTGLTPEEMDNTVIHMARYQQSFDQFCQ